MDEKKELLLDAASKVFSTEGFHKAKITKIAEMAGVGAGSVYLYFKNKESILEELFLRSWSEIERQLDSINAATAIDSVSKVKIFVRSIINLLERNRNLAALVLHEYSFWSSVENKSVHSIVARTNSALQKLIAEGIDNGELNSKLNVEFATYYIIGGFWQVLSKIADSDSPVNTEEVVNDLETLVLTGLK